MSWASNDDSVAPDFVDRILEALKLKPDYVGFDVLYTEDGAPQLPVKHDLLSGGWFTQAGVIYRDLMHYNPIRWELAMQVRFRGDPYLADRVWAADLRALGCVKTQVYIHAPMYYYRHSSRDDFVTRREPMPPPLPELPQYRWLRYIHA